MIQFENVVKRFRRNQVLKGVDLNIERGHRVALVGSNGAGKTTLIRCLLGEYTCEGRVLVDGLDPRQHRRAVLSKVGFVPQLPPPLKMPVRQLVRFAASLCDADPRRIETVAGRLGLDVENFHGQPFVKLSGDRSRNCSLRSRLDGTVNCWCWTNRRPIWIPGPAIFSFSFWPRKRRPRPC